MSEWWKAARAALSHGAGTAFVAMFCYVTVGFVPSLRETYWAPIAAIVVLYQDRDATRKAGVDRLFGTVIGSVIGWLSATYWHEHVVIYGLAVLIAVALCDLLRLAAAARLCAVAVTVITIIPRPELPGVTALHRCIEVSYGVACALGYTFAVDYVAKRRTGSAR